MYNTEHHHAAVMAVWSVMFPILMRRAMWAFVNDPASAEDAVQSVFVWYYTRSKLEHIDRLLVWRLRTEIRNRRRMRIHEAPESPNIAESTEPSPDRTAIVRQLLATVLQDPDAAFAVCYTEEGAAVAAAAYQISSVAAARVKMCRFRARSRKHIEELSPNGRLAP